MATKRIRLPGPPPTEGSGSTPLTIEFLVEQPFLATREHARFVEFAEACAHYRYIGVSWPAGRRKDAIGAQFSSFPTWGNMPRSVPLPRSLAKGRSLPRRLLHRVGQQHAQDDRRGVGPQPH
jgi:hypothetical protein